MPGIFQFSDYVLDSRRFELRRGERALKLEKIPMELLILLIEREGTLVSREEIIERIWGKDVFFESDTGINTAVSKLRQALRDGAERPKYIQTVVGKGYRFIAPISQLEPPGIPAKQEAERAIAVSTTLTPASTQSRQTVLRRLVLILASLTLAFLLVAAGHYALRSRAVRSPQTLAVLPFEPLSQGERDEYLELGIADALITKLSRSGGLIVRPTSAIRKYTGAEVDPLAAGRALQVDAVLEGNIQHLADRLRISTRLIRVSDGTGLWSDSYDARFTDVFQVQDTVSQHVVDALAIQVSNLGKAGLRKRDTPNIQAYELYTRGIYCWNKRSEDGIKKAASYFEQAIAFDNNYALAYAGLADSLTAEGYMGYRAPAEVRPKIRAAAMRAISLDPTLPEAHIAMAAVLTFYEWNWSEGEKEFQRALQLDPNSPLAHHWYALLLECVDRYQEALKHRQRAHELDPITPVISSGLGEALLLAGDGERALTEFHKALELEDTLELPRIGIGDVYELRGDYAHAISEYRLAVKYSPGGVRAKAALAYALPRTGAKDEANQVLAELTNSSREQYVSPVQLAIIWTGLGDNEMALNWLEKAYDQGDPALAGVTTEWRFRSLRTDPRFRKLLQKIGLEA
jgi:TolB-like protein/DNA-binding winged helix-turn-helix (wHTH) protein/Flp pilus assembly protein TadD